jgi:hypothetical protein
MRFGTMIPILAAAFAAGPAQAQVCSVCVAEQGKQQAQAPQAVGTASHGAEGGNNEQSALVGTLTDMGFSVIETSDPTQEACNIYVSHPGNSINANGPPPDAAWVQAGNGVVQISDWGPDIQTNDFDNGDGGVETVTVVDAGHPITQGVPGSWATVGFWHYGIPGGEYTGWVTDPDPNLARISGMDRGLSARPEGAGRVVYIGWNVYGPDATVDDLTILRQAIEWAGQCSVPVELESFDAE